MGQKVNPVGFRLGTSRDHDSVWYAKSKDYSKLVLEDIKVRDRVREIFCLLYTSPSPRDAQLSRMPSSA